MCRDTISTRNTGNKTKDLAKENRIHPLFAGLVSTKTTPTPKIKTRLIKTTNIPKATETEILSLLKKNLTQKVIAAITGVSQSTVSYTKLKYFPPDETHKRTRKVYSKERIDDLLAKGYTQKQVAAEIGVTQTIISRYVTRKNMS